MHQIAYTLVVDAHDSADILIFALLHIIEIDDLALAMEARCYRGGEGRTRMKEMKLGRLDYVAIGVFAVLSVGLGVSYGL